MCSKNEHFLALDSIKVTFKLLNTIASTNPGKPAPVPKSHKDSVLFKSIAFVKHNES